MVSVRAPLASPSGADALCGQFGGGGRARAAGIDGLPADDLERFLAAFASTRWGELTSVVLSGVRHSGHKLRDGGDPSC